MKGAQSETRNTMYRVKILRGLFNSYKVEKCHGNLGARLANDGFIQLVVDLC